MKSLTQLKNLYLSYIQNTSAANATLAGQLINDAHRYLLQKFFNNEFTSTALTVAAQQFYPVPANYSKMKTVTVNVGQLKYTLIEIFTREEWDKTNAMPYTSSIPVYFFIYNSTSVGIWPIPSDSGNTITYNYKIRVPELTIADIVGTCTMATNSASITTCSSDILASTLATASSAVNLNLYLQPAIPKGDNNWYQVSSIGSSSALTLANIYTGQSSVTVPFTIGQMPYLLEDFQDLIVYWAVMRYFSTIQKDMEKFKAFETLYKEGEERLSEYCGQKTIQVNLGRRVNLQNPNLYGQSFGANP